MLPLKDHQVDEWIDKHPRLAWVVTIGLAVIIMELAAIVKLLVEAKG